MRVRQEGGYDKGALLKAPHLVHGDEGEGDWDSLNGHEYMMH